MTNNLKSPINKTTIDANMAGPSQRAKNLKCTLEYCFNRSSNVPLSDANFLDFFCNMLNPKPKQTKAMPIANHLNAGNVFLYSCSSMASDCRTIK